MDIRKLRREQKLCTMCGKPTDGVYKLCEEHREKRRLYAASRRGKSCQVCGGIIEISGHCRPCWLVRMERLRARRIEKRANRECLTCKEPAAEGHTHCELCRQKNSNRSKNKRIARAVEGMCYRCGQVEVEGKRRCTICFLKETSFNHFGSRKFCDLLESILESQGGVCPYTGFKLVLGENASLDHKIPKSREGSNEKENLQWVYMNGTFDVNRMKMDMTDLEFRDAIHKLKGGV